MSYKPDGMDVGIGCVVAIASVPVRAWVLTVLWRWFIVPLGVPAIGMLTAIGIALTVGLVVYRPGPRVKWDDENDWYSSVGATLLAPLFTLLLGVLVRGLAS